MQKKAKPPQIKQTSRKQKRSSKATNYKARPQETGNQFLKSKTRNSTSMQFMGVQKHFKQQKLTNIAY